jgi:hypothetical protein
MALTFTGHKSPGLSGTALEAYDGGKRVVVVVTHEAEQDFGLSRAQEIGRAKYAHNQIENDGTSE